MTPSKAANILVRRGAQFVDEALLANPDGPIRIVTELSLTKIVYAVTIGTGGGVRDIWSDTVPIGHGRLIAAMAAARRIQDEVAFAALELLEDRRGRQ